MTTYKIIKLIIFEILVKMIGPFYNLAWKLYPGKTQTVVFVLCQPLDFALTKNIFVHLKGHLLFPTNTETKKLINQNHHPTSSLPPFPRFIAATDFIETVFGHHYHEFPFILKLILNNPKIKKIQLYHGVIDKHWTFSPKNHNYSLLLVPGNYAKNRLQQVGIPSSKIKIVGFPKLDNLFRKSANKTSKPTILYAPTWGITSSLPFMLKHLLKLKKHYNLIIKLHQHTEFSYFAFFKHHKFNLTQSPDISDYFQSSDLLISDFSSVMFEFATTNKPIIALNFTLWQQQFPPQNSRNGPEIQLRHLFIQVDKVSTLESKISQALSTKIPPHHYDPITKDIFSFSSQKSGSRTANAIKSYVSAQLKQPQQ